eukprot:2768796-Rhodomonas_salina.1
MSAHGIVVRVHVLARLLRIRPWPPKNFSFLSFPPQKSRSSSNDFSRSLGSLSSGLIVGGVVLGCSVEVVPSTLCFNARFQGQVSRRCEARECKGLVPISRLLGTHQVPQYEPRHLLGYLSIAYISAGNRTAAQRMSVPRYARSVPDMAYQARRQIAGHILPDTLGQYRTW